MAERMVLVSGGAAVGKTALLKHLIAGLPVSEKPYICKIDCLGTSDHLVFREMGIPAVAGLSGDICPDHYLASNMGELLEWTEAGGGSILFVETAGLCHRCCPATEKTVNICVVDCTTSVHGPEKLGPMLTTADAVALTKIDLISQAEREILTVLVRELNETAVLFPIDGLCGYGTELLIRWILSTPVIPDFEGDVLRTTMPSGVCSYCIGETRIGKHFQQGVVKKIAIK